MELPVYLFAGFLDSGKTRFINNILTDGFALDDKTLLICCEEGENDYNTKYLYNVTVVRVEDEEELTRAFLEECEKKYKPAQVLIEFNGMWSMERLYREVLPDHWILYQILTLVDAHTFELYVANMGQLMMEKIMNADMLVFNRCTPALKESLRKRNLRMVNRRADIYLENEDGTDEEYLTGDECPFDLSQNVVDIPNDDYGIWFVDVMDHPERYAGKTVHLNLVMCHSKQFPGVCCPGRFAMVCCDKDVQFLGLIAEGEGLTDYKNHDWVEVTARMEAEEREPYGGIGPVMHILSIAPTEKADPEIVSF